jgi:ADP-ribose pyrophosphatase YjhB (NUDIX family)
MVRRAVVAIVNYDGKVLLGKKRKDSPKVLAGQWHFPGETLEEYESDIGALVRGIKAEANLDIRVGKYLGKSIFPTSKRYTRWYECFSKTGEISAGSDLEEVKWVPKNKVLESCSEKARNLCPQEVLDYFN